MLWKKTIIMLIAFGVLTVAAIGVTAIPTGGKGPSLNLPALEKERISRIEVSNTETPVILERTAEAWKIQPAGYKADKNAIESALSTLADLAAGTMISKSVSNHEKYGVGDSSMILTVTTADKKTIKLIVGNESADKRGNYIRKPGDNKVFVSNKRIQAMFSKDPNRWRDRLIAQFDKEKAKALTLNYKGQTLSFAKNDAGKWQFAPVPENLPADFLLDSEKVDQVARVLSNLRAADFEDNVTSLKAIGLEPPLASAKITLTEGDPITIQLGNDKDKKTIAARPDDEQVYLLSEYTVKKLIQTLEDFRDLHVTKFDMDKANKVQIDKEGKKLVFAKDKNWNLVESSEQLPADFRLDPKKVESLVRTASTFQAKALVGKGANAGKTEGTLTVTLDDGTTKKIIVGGQAGDKEVFVTGDDKTVFTAMKHSADRLVQDLDKFKVTAKRQQPMLSPEALKNLPPEVAQQLMQKQRKEIMQKQIINQMMKNQESQK